VRVQVIDDGQGFDARSMNFSERPSWGLTGMHERATLLGGKFALSSRLGEGTRVEVSIPYQEDTEVSDENTSPAGG
jgi:signal transduction histidine kinase